MDLKLYIGVLIWYLIFRLENDLETATFPVTVGGIVVDVSLDNVGGLVNDGSKISRKYHHFNRLYTVLLLLKYIKIKNNYFPGSVDAQAKLETLLLLVIRLVGLIPVGIGTISSILIILGKNRNNINLKFNLKSFHY